MCERCGGEAHAHMHNRLPPVTGNPLQRHATPLKHPLKRRRAPLLTCVLYCRRHSVPVHRGGAKGGLSSWRPLPHRPGQKRPHSTYREGNLQGQNTHGQQGSSQARTRRGEHRAPQPPKGKEATCAYTAQRALRTPVGNLQPKAARAQAVAKVQRSHGGRRTMTWMPTVAPRGRDALKPIRRIQMCAARNEPSRWKGGARNSTTRTVPCSRRARA